MKRIWINKKYISSIATTIIGGIYAFFGFIGNFVSLDGVLPQELPFYSKVLISLAILVFLWIVCFLIVGCTLSRRKRFEVICGNNGHKLYVQYGDLFDANEVLNPCERRNIIIPVNRCFDTIVDNHLVSEQTLHGIAFKQLYSSVRYTEQSLNAAIQRQLSNQPYQDIDIIDKPEGNLRRYPVGTIADIPSDETTHLFLWALSTFNRELKAQTSMQDYALAVQKLIEACNSESEGFPILIPLVGTGLSRTKKDQKDVLSYLVQAFKLNKSELNCDIHIIVRETIKSDIPIMNLK